MTWTRKLLVAMFALLPIAALPAAALGQPAGRPDAKTDAKTDGKNDGKNDGKADTELTPQERDLLTTAEQLATDGAQVMEQWMLAQATSEDRLFARLYYPVAAGDFKACSRPCYRTAYDSLADRDFVSLEDKTLAHAAMLQYAILTDINGYVPAHNTRFAQPLTGNAEQDYINNRTKRLLGDAQSLLAARNEGRFLIQRVRLETGDVIYDISVPITVRGKHWGCARIGYRRAE